MGIYYVGQRTAWKVACYPRKDRCCAAGGPDVSSRPSGLRSSLATAGQPIEGWVWPASTRSGRIESCSLKRQHRNALRLSGVRPFVLYSLRHTFLTRLGESGCDAWTLARIAGHSNMTISSRYVHPSEEAVLNALSRLGSHKIGHSDEQPQLEREAPKLLSQ